MIACLAVACVFDFAFFGFAIAFSHSLTYIYNVRAMNNDFFEPSCPVPVAPRYSSRPLPPYRFIPGINAHPVRDPDGHSFGREEKMTDEQEEFLFGVDLYNQAYWWESHEAWENIWMKKDKESDAGQFLQGLIQISAALIKWHLHQREGMAKLYKIGLGRLQSVADHHPIFMGVDLRLHLKCLEKHFAKVLSENAAWVDACEEYPFLMIMDS